MRGFLAGVVRKKLGLDLLSEAGAFRSHVIVKSAAIPFMHLAKSVRVISVDRDASNRQASQAEVLAYLRCHGIGATAQVVTPELRSVGDTLLAAGAEHEAGLLVMGAYSHSRLREMLLGGATRHILKNALARPVLLAH